MQAGVAVETHSEPAKAWSGVWRNYLVWSAWAVLASIAIIFVVKYHHRFPYSDEYWMVQHSMGVRPITWAWLWAPHNEHRILIGKLAYVILARITHCKWSVVIFMDMLLLLIMSAAALFWLRSWRGHLKYTDILIPLLFLSLGQWENLLQGFQTCFVLWFPSVCYLILATQFAPPGLPGFHAVGVGLCLLAQPLFGSQGLPYGAALACWYAANGVFLWRSARLPRHRCRAAALIIVAFLTWAEIGMYFVGLGSRLRPELCPNFSGFVRGMAEFLTCGWLPGANENLQKPTIILFAACVGLACLKLYSSQERLRSFGVLMCLVAALGLAAEISFGRVHLGKNLCASSRYMTLAVPGLLACYCALELLSKHRLSAVLQLCMLAVALATFRENYRTGVVNGKGVVRTLRHFQEDIRAGVPARELAERHYLEQGLLTAHLKVFTDLLELMQNHGSYPFK